MEGGRKAETMVKVRSFWLTPLLLSLQGHSSLAQMVSRFHCSFFITNRKQSHLLKEGKDELMTVFQNLCPSETSSYRFWCIPSLIHAFPLSLTCLSLPHPSIIAFAFLSIAWLTRTLPLPGISWHLHTRFCEMVCTWLRIIGCMRGRVCPSLSLLG